MFTSNTAAIAARAVALTLHDSANSFAVFCCCCLASFWCGFRSTLPLTLNIINHLNHVFIYIPSSCRVPLGSLRSIQFKKISLLLNIARATLNMLISCFSCVHLHQSSMAHNKFHSIYWPVFNPHSTMVRLCVNWTAAKFTSFRYYLLHRPRSQRYILFCEASNHIHPP